MGQPNGPFALRTARLAGVLSRVVNMLMSTVPPILLGVLIGVASQH